MMMWGRVFEGASAPPSVASHGAPISPGEESGEDSLGVFDLQALKLCSELRDIDLGHAKDRDRGRRQSLNAHRALDVAQFHRDGRSVDRVTRSRRRQLATDAHRSRGDHRRVSERLDVVLDGHHANRLAQ